MRTTAGPRLRGRSAPRGRTRVPARGCRRSQRGRPAAQSSNTRSPPCPSGPISSFSWIFTSHPDLIIRFTYAFRRASASPGSLPVKLSAVMPSSRTDRRTPSATETVSRRSPRPSTVLPSDSGCGIGGGQQTLLHGHGAVLRRGLQVPEELQRLRVGVRREHREVADVQRSAPHLPDRLAVLDAVAFPDVDVRSDRRHLHLLLIGRNRSSSSTIQLASIL